MAATAEVFGMPCPVRVECRPAVCAAQFRVENAHSRAESLASAASAIADGSFEQNSGTSQAHGTDFPQNRLVVRERKGAGSALQAGELTAGQPAVLLGACEDDCFVQQTPHSPGQNIGGQPCGQAQQGAEPASARPALVSAKTISTATAPRPLPALQLSLPAETRPDASAPSMPDWRFSFEDFVVGPCNAFAYEASRSMCSHMASSNVLFLSSAPGLGKTHLAQAVGKKLGEVCNRRRPQMEYLTAEAFASAFYHSLKTQTTDSFKSHYRSLDLLLLEDVHFLQGKEKMQAEFLETLKALGDRGSKVVFTSSFAPRDLKFMDEQLQSRLASGLLTLIERPDEETRRKILRKKASVHQVLLPEDVEDALVRHIQTDIRQLESCLHNLILKAKLLNSRITSQMVWDVISHYASHSPVLNMDSIIAHVCRGFGLSKDQLMSSSRKQNYVTARNAAFFLARKHTDFSFEAIGRVFNRKHSTVIKGITALEREMSRNTPEGAQITNVLAMIERNGNLF